MQLKDYFDRIEQTKAMKRVLRLKKMTPSDRQEQDYLVETYRTTLGL